MPATLLVSDSWPVLEWLKAREPTATLFEELIADAFSGNLSFRMSRINDGEVLYTIRKDLPPTLVNAALKAFHEIPIKFYSVDDVFIEEAAAIKAVYPVSFADAFVAALALRLKAQVLTGDKDFRLLATLGVQVYWVGA